jgi:hypothetical protein
MVLDYTFNIYTHLLCGGFQVIVRKWDAQEERLIKLPEEEVIYQTLLESLSYARGGSPSGLSLFLEMLARWSLCAFCMLVTPAVL